SPPLLGLALALSRLPIHLPPHLLPHRRPPPPLHRRIPRQTLPPRNQGNHLVLRLRQMPQPPRRHLLGRQGRLEPRHHPALRRPALRPRSRNPQMAQTPNKIPRQKKTSEPPLTQK